MGEAEKFWIASELTRNSGSTRITCSGRAQAQLTFHANGTVTGSWTNISPPEGEVITPDTPTFTPSADPHWISYTDCLPHCTNAERRTLTRVMNEMWREAAWGGDFWRLIRWDGGSSWQYGESRVSLSDLVQLSPDPRFRRGLDRVSEVSYRVLFKVVEELRVQHGL